MHIKKESRSMLKFSLNYIKFYEIKISSREGKKNPWGSKRYTVTLLSDGENLHTFFKAGKKDKMSFNTVLLKS